MHADLEGERVDGFEIEVEKVEGRKNTRRIKAQVRIDAQLETVWAVLTNYEGLADFIPGLAVSQLLHYEDKCARIYQVCFFFNIVNFLIAVVLLVQLAGTVC
jgi:Polyketide cyclase / dehydrase and lipid transport